MQILSILPSPTNAPLNAPVVVTFDAPIDALTVDNASITVATSKTNIVSPKFGDLRLDPLSNDDLFFHSEFTGVVNGVATVDGTVLTFTPQSVGSVSPYSPNTDYTVYISESIADLNGNVLGTTTTYKFKTVAEDVVAPFENPTPTTTIIGKNIDFNTASPSPGAAFYIKSTTPKNGGILGSQTVIKVRFNIDVDEDGLSHVVITRVGVFSDYEPEEISSDNYTLSCSGKVLTITVESNIINTNEIVSVTIHGTYPDKTEAYTLGADYTFTYTTLLSPYYSSVRLMRLKAGTLLTAIPDSSLALLIHYSSLEANDMLEKFVNYSKLNKFREKYSLFSALKKALLNNFDFALNDAVKQQLSDYSLSISSGTKVKLYNRLLDEITKFENQMTLYINFGASGSGLFKKGSAHGTDIGRQWYRGVQPGLNERDFRNRFVWDEFGEPLPFNYEGVYNVTSDRIYIY